jgi:protein ImuB
LVEIDGDGLRLDVSGVAHLFGGEAELIEDIKHRFAQLGLAARVAIAPTGRRRLGAEPFRRCRIGPSPRLCLRLEPDTVCTLERLGLKTIGAILDMPRLALARRFRGVEDVVDALDRMLGSKDEPLTAAPAELPPRAWSSSRSRDPSRSRGQALERLIPALSGIAGAAPRCAAADADRLSRRWNLRGRFGRHGDPQPRAEAFAAPARRQGR